MPTLTLAQQTLLKNKLLDDLTILKQKVKTRLRISSKEHLKDLVSQIDDMNADTLIESLSNVESHSLNRYREEIKSIDAALQEMEMGLYGLCSDCEEELNIDELFSNPAKQRCTKCEIKYNNQKLKGFPL